MLSLILGASALVAGQAAAACTRGQLVDVASKFIASARGSGITFKTAPSIKYTENYKDVDIASGVYSKAINIAHTRQLLDSTGCGIYVEVIAPDNTPGYQLATQVWVDADGAATKVETVITSSDANSNSWFYDGKRALQVIQEEEQSGFREPIPEAQRASREHLKGVADAYFTLFGGSTGARKVPNFAPSCLRQEGGFPQQLNCSLAVGQPTQAKGTPPTCGTITGSTPNPDIRGYIIDETVGSVEALAKFAGSPDSHDFRIENCEVVLVHAVTTTSSALSGILSAIQGLLGGGTSSGGSSGSRSGLGGLLSGLGGLFGGAQSSGSARASGSAKPSAFTA